jgi:hypothetical protein
LPVLNFQNLDPVRPIRIGIQSPKQAMALRADELGNMLNEAEVVGAHAQDILRIQVIEGVFTLQQSDRQQLPHQIYFSRPGHLFSLQQFPETACNHCAIFYRCVTMYPEN